MGVQFGVLFATHLFHTPEPLNFSLTVAAMFLIAASLVGLVKALRDAWRELEAHPNRRQDRWVM